MPVKTTPVQPMSAKGLLPSLRKKLIEQEAALGFLERILKLATDRKVTLPADLTSSILATITTIQSQRERKLRIAMVGGMAAPTPSVAAALLGPDSQALSELATKTQAYPNWDEAPPRMSDEMRHAALAAAADCELAIILLTPPFCRGQARLIHDCAEHLRDRRNGLIVVLVEGEGELIENRSVPAFIETLRQQRLPLLSNEVYRHSGEELLPALRDWIEPRLGERVITPRIPLRKPSPGRGDATPWPEIEKGILAAVRQKLTDLQAAKTACESQIDKYSQLLDQHSIEITALHEQSEDLRVSIAEQSDIVRKSLLLKDQIAAKDSAKGNLSAPSLPYSEGRLRTLAQSLIDEGWNDYKDAVKRAAKVKVNKLRMASKNYRKELKEQSLSSGDASRLSYIHSWQLTVAPDYSRQKAVRSLETTLSGPVTENHQWILDQWTALGLPTKDKPAALVLTEIAQVIKRTIAGNPGLDPKPEASAKKTGLVPLTVGSGTLGGTLATLALYSAKATIATAAGTAAGGATAAAAPVYYFVSWRVGNSIIAESQAELDILQGKDRKPLQELFSKSATAVYQNFIDPVRGALHATAEKAKKQAEALESSRRKVENEKLHRAELKREAERELKTELGELEAQIGTLREYLQSESLRPKS